MLIAFFALSIGILALVSLFIRYHVRFNDKQLHYSVTLFGKAIFQYPMHAEKNQKIYFKRVGWSTKGAFVYVNKKLPVRLINFKPEEMYDELLLFAKANHVPVRMREDYKVLRTGITKNS